MKYKFRDNSPYKDKNAQAVGEYLFKTFPTRQIQPKDIVVIAKFKNNPLHEYFEWDDSLAAEKYRLGQARGLISALYVEMSDGEEIRAYENVYIKEIDSQAYMDINDVANTPHLAEQVIESALKELTYWKLKYEQYQSRFKRLFTMIDQTVKEKEHGSKNKKGSGKGNTNPDSTDRVKDRKNNTRRRNTTVGV